MALPVEATAAIDKAAASIYMYLALVIAVQVVGVSLAYVFGGQSRAKRKSILIGINFIGLTLIALYAVPRIFFNG